MNEYTTARLTSGAKLGYPLLNVCAVSGAFVSAGAVNLHRSYMLLRDEYNIDEIAIRYLPESIDNVQQTIRITYAFIPRKPILSAIGVAKCFPQLCVTQISERKHSVII
uniref:Uncharacterized protein n=1 Tax=Glossina pallidipes TaxID=7398 RepID=A0A1A9Z4M3_GLOPL